MANSVIDRIDIRMYCIGTGDCFVLKFFERDEEKMVMMIDCGCCTGDADKFEPYINDIATYTNREIDLLVVTHEHQDHVNGFAKCRNIFETFTFKEAWFAWTEHPDDPDGLADALKKKRNEMRLAFDNSFAALKERFKDETKYDGSFYKNSIVENNKAFLEGLTTLAEINLPAAGEEKESLAGMKAIKEMVEKDNRRPKYLKPGEIRTHRKAPGIKFYVLGPPIDRSYIFKDGKTGRDVFSKNILFSNNGFSEAALNNSNENVQKTELPFHQEYVINEPELKEATLNAQLSADDVINQKILDTYASDAWRRIDDDWLNSTGTLALRLNSHINNTSLVLAIEFQNPDKKVILFPGDAEFGSWDSWHAIEKWKPKGDNKKHLVEDLLNRTVFYKVGHHLSYNGTALEKGIKMMNSPELVAFATLDRGRISSKWKSTMPNKLLLEELITRCQGKIVIMNEMEIDNQPSKVLDLTTLGEEIYKEDKIPGTEDRLYKQYTITV